MKILGIDSSGMTAGAAVIDEEKIIAEVTVCSGHTHSETLLPMVDEVLKNSAVKPEELDAIAVAAGPGSFTGLRIGAATVKGLGLAVPVPVAAVPTCEGLAMNLHGVDRIVCPLIDARRNQVYTGLYRVNRDENPGLEVICDQYAADIQEVIDKVNTLGEPVIFLGDGTALFKGILQEGVRIKPAFALPSQNLQRASSVAAAGLYRLRRGEVASADEFVPIYLRPSQAERVREESGR